ncbi:MAG: 3-deoxy-D-manno-octulosonic acid transferase [Maribacter sp.]|nr:3-deoxy-D-manno-octulosonic acid transferase [Maribacter sp.]
MYFIYNLVVILIGFHLRIVAWFHPKIKLFVNGRKQTFSTLQKTIHPTDKIIWIHVASLGEYEQGLPVIKKIRKAYVDHKILVTFFSPSGYEIKKNTGDADIVVYLPLDTQKNVTRFLRLTHPKLAIFVKYEIWPNYLKELRYKNIPTLMISALFKSKQIYFRPYGGFMQKALRTFTHFFLQDENSKILLESIGFTNCTVSGDTRFDRVSEILAQDNSLSFMQRFKGKSLCLVAGSTWPEDEAILVDFINSAHTGLKYVLAPHTIKSDHVQHLQRNILKKSCLYSELESIDAAGCEVLIIDTIGLLTKIYSYADAAYVGGGFVTGLHNTLEPATFGIPVIIGPNYGNFKEAIDLVAKHGIQVIRSKDEFTLVMNRFLNEPQFRDRTGAINRAYVAENKGASVQIMEYIRKLL